MRMPKDSKMKTNIELEAAQQLALDSITSVKTCYVLLQEATGRVLSADICAANDLPPFNKSPLDGYALRAQDTIAASGSNPVTFDVIEEVPAGYIPTKKVVPGTAIKVMTGAPIPEGADIVIKYEDVKRDGNIITLSYSLKAGANIILAGDDVMKGDVIARQGTVITPPLAGLFAGVGVWEVPVYDRVKVALLSTGDELLDPSQELEPGKIYNSNLHCLVGLCSELRVIPIPVGIVPDRKDVTAERIRESLERADLVITTGGVSVGDYDMVLGALQDINADIVFWKIDMKPGSPVVVAQKDGKLIIGLSGNPAAALITFELIAVPLIKKMSGQKTHLPKKISAILQNDFDKPSPQRRFLRAHCFSDGVNRVELTGEQGNGILTSMIHCNALIDIPAGSGPLCKGQTVTALLLGK